MAYLKIRHKEQEGYIGGKYHDRDSFHDVISYVLRPEKTPSHYIGGIGVDVLYAAAQMETLSACFGQNQGVHLRHMILAFENGELYRSRKHALALAYQLAYPIAQFYGDCYQVIYAVHEDTDNVHIHFVMNTTNYRTGRKYPGTKEDYYRFVRHVEHILEPYGCKVKLLRDRTEWEEELF
ncbi:relaxase/mobilization nuclease domain-containing protein [Intestinimonas massiliensis (ex Afouda et al. 2020)]|uniref:relaxase/mobilization nuclease domain-containing protein n=1 Tax=Intestinimonas massiliensis (ex Afouda et al. 2020) TaxID=1673721 RepID=UPI0010311BEF|nr:relaxase/mobilization nuclease domain-containing protein [Intestinimonas massiliensis (ex Afouda et al. 2020)]